MIFGHDLFDAVYAIFVAQELDVDQAEIVRVFLKKTIFEPSPGAAKNLLLGLPFELFRGFWGNAVCPSPSRMTFDEAVTQLATGLEVLFGPFGYGRQFEGAFFPAELRNPILEAGSERKLVELRYDGVTRLVEPYALTFKRRQDGLAREHPDGYDRTRGPSIKSFVAGKISIARRDQRAIRATVRNRVSPRPATRKARATSLVRTARVNAHDRFQVIAYRPFRHGGGDQPPGLGSPITSPARTVVNASSGPSFRQR